jgi:homocysteine S-methyltransferase
MNVKEYLKNKNLLFDGGYGTYFSLCTNKEASLSESFNLTDPSFVEKIHREYIKNGAKAIKTNTFSPGENYEECIRAASHCAKNASEGKVFIFADMGPLPKSLEEGNPYLKMVDVFFDEGIENFLFETLCDNDKVLEAAEYIKGKSPDSFIIVSYAVSPAGYTNTGRFYASLIREAEKCDAVDSVGLNCMSGPNHLMRLAEKIRTTKILSVMPNAGYPTVIGSRTVYSKSEEYFALVAKDIVKNGARIIGGCCGTTPSFTHWCEKEGIEDIKHIQVKEEENFVSVKEKTDDPFYNKLLRGEKVIAIELDPPQDTDLEFFTSAAVKLKDAGCDIITIADCPIARPRMDSSILACKLKRELGIDVLPHMTCRDRNLNATKALLLGLKAEGVNNILTVTGDPVPGEKRDEVKSVFNFNSRMLIKFISSLNETTFSSPMNICAALNINAVNFDMQLNLAKEKVENGAKVFLTQPMMSEDALKNLRRAKRELDAKILCGIMPPVSYRNAMYMQNEIAGITVDEKIIDLFYDKSKEEAEEIGKMVALKAIEAAEEYSDGYYLITPFKRVDMMCEIIHKIAKK